MYFTVLYIGGGIELNVLQLDRILYDSIIELSNLQAKEAESIGLPACTS